MRNAFVRVISEMADKDKDIYLLTGDIGFGVLTAFWENYPDQFVNVGISEQNMTSVAAGMGLEGKKVYTYSIANFSTLRCIEQIRNDVSYHDVNVTIVSVGTGFSYGAMGMSHHATEDLAMLRSIPNMTIFSPCDSVEVEQVTRLSLKINGPCYIRLGRGGEAIVNESNAQLSLGKANCIKEGSDTAVFVADSLVCEVLKAAELLSGKGISCAVYSFPTVKPIDEVLIKRVASQMKYVFTCEEHNVLGGVGGAVAEVLSGILTSTRLVRLGLKDCFTDVVGSQKFLREYYGLSGFQIAETIIKTLK